MQTQIPAQQVQQNQSQSRTEHKSPESAQPQFEDARPEAMAQLRLQSLMANNARTTQLKSMQAMMAASTPGRNLGQSLSAINPIPVQRMEDEGPLQAKTDEPIQREQSESPVDASPPKPNNTGLPDNLKTGIENLSGMSMDHVKVHYNSGRPAQLQAHAYAQGSEIHMAPGQEKHLPHEAWHVVQQAQGRVKPTVQMKSGVPVNDDAGLEHEADVMGAEALQLFKNDVAPIKNHLGGAIATMPLANPVAQNMVAQLSPLSMGVLNVVGENHPETGARLEKEKAYCAKFSGSTNYWTENQFKVRAYSLATDYLSDKRARADPFKDRFEHVLLKAGSTNPWHYQADEAPENFKVYVRDNPGSLAGALTGGTLRFSRDMKIMIGNLEADTDGHELTALSKQTHIALKNDVNNLYAQASTCVARLTGGQDVPGTVAALDLMWTNLKTLVAAYGALRTDPEVRVSRSEAMHQAAEARSGEKGVWKIGEKHRKDIAGEYATYNLVSEDTFNYDYIDWRTETLTGRLRDADTGQRGIGDDIGDDDL
jgi:hypothetical protein